MPDFDWRSVIRVVAPTLAGAIGGPLAPIAAAAVKVLGDKLLGNPEATEDEIAVAVAGGLSGDQLIALKAGEQQFTLEMERIYAQREAASMQDTQGARQQTVELARTASSIAWAAPVISTVIVVGFFGCVAMLFIVERTWDERTANLLNVLFGALIPGFVQVCNYWLGSSAGSKRAGDAVRKIAEQAGAT